MEDKQIIYVDQDAFDLISELSENVFYQDSKANEENKGIIIELIKASKRVIVVNRTLICKYYWDKK